MSPQITTVETTIHGDNCDCVALADSGTKSCFYAVLPFPNADLASHGRHMPDPKLGSKGLW